MHYFSLLAYCCGVHLMMFLVLGASQTPAHSFSGSSHLDNESQQVNNTGAGTTRRMGLRDAQLFRSPSLNCTLSTQVRISSLKCLRNKTERFNPIRPGLFGLKNPAGILKDRWEFFNINSGF